LTGSGVGLIILGWIDAETDVILSPVKVGSYDTYLWYWRVLTPQAITFDPEGVRP
jgi:hypothetical protein